MGLTQQMPLAFLAQLSWFQTYLFDRTQVVSVNGNSSPPSVMKFGVPQGSVLGPILFVLYTQPLLDIVHHHSMSHHSFSDDNQLYKSGHISQLLNIIQSTQRCISDLRDWMTNSKLQLNEDKTDMILISPRKVLNYARIPSELCLNGTNIKLLTRLFHFNNIFQMSAVLAILSSAESAQSVATSLKMPQKF